MSHANPVFSPEGTPTAKRTVGELVAERPNLSRIFQQHHIDFCCQGARTLEEVCKKHNLSLDDLLRQIEEVAEGRTSSGFNPANLPMSSLADYIVERHHGYLKNELPRLHQMSRRVAQVHGPHTPSLVLVYEIFCQVEKDMNEHMEEEEADVFPAIKALANADSEKKSLKEPIANMMHEHAETGAALEKLRELTNNFQPPAEACNTYRALFAGLQELEEDMHTHIHLENSVLFPTAEKLTA